MGGPGRRRGHTRNSGKVNIPGYVSSLLLPPDDHKQQVKNSPKFYLTSKSQEAKTQASALWPSESATREKQFVRFGMLAEFSIVFIGLNFLFSHWVLGKSFTGDHLHPSSHDPLPLRAVIGLQSCSPLKSNFFYCISRWRPFSAVVICDEMDVTWTIKLWLLFYIYSIKDIGVWNTMGSKCGGHLQGPKGEEHVHKLLGKEIVKRSTKQKSPKQKQTNEQTNKHQAKGIWGSHQG